MRHVSKIDGGFQFSHHLVARVQLPDPAYTAPAAKAAFLRNFETNLARESELIGTGVGAPLPVGDGIFGAQFFVQQPTGDFPQDPALFQIRRIGASYLSSLGIPLLRGRQFDQRDQADPPSVAIVSKALADHYWPGENPIGKRLRRASGQIVMEIIGVAGNVMDAGFSAPPAETVYAPYVQWSVRKLSIVVQPRTTTESAISALRRALMATDANLAIYDVDSLDRLTREANAIPRLQMTLLLVFAAIAIAITALGSYGVMSQLVTNRERELAVRLAVGASPAALWRDVLWQNARLSLGGIALGVTAAWLLGGLMQSFVFGIAPRSVGVLAAVAGVTLLLTLIATLVPAWRAAHVDVRKVVGSA